MQEPVASEEDVLELTDTYEARRRDHRRSGHLDARPLPGQPRPLYAPKNPTTIPAAGAGADPDALGRLRHPRRRQRRGRRRLGLRRFRLPPQEAGSHGNLTATAGPDPRRTGPLAAAPDAEGLARRQPSCPHRRGRGTQGSRTHRPQRRPSFTCAPIFSRSFQGGSGGAGPFSHSNDRLAPATQNDRSSPAARACRDRATRMTMLDKTFDPKDRRTAPLRDVGGERRVRPELRPPSATGRRGRTRSSSRRRT